MRATVTLQDAERARILSENAISRAQASVVNSFGVTSNENHLTAPLNSLSPKQKLLAIIELWRAGETGNISNFVANKEDSEIAPYFSKAGATKEDEKKRKSFLHFLMMQEFRRIEALIMGLAKDVRDGRISLERISTIMHAEGYDNDFIKDFVETVGTAAYKGAHMAGRAIGNLARSGFNATRNLLDRIYNPEPV